MKTIFVSRFEYFAMPLYQLANTIGFLTDNYADGQVKNVLASLTKFTINRGCKAGCSSLFKREAVLLKRLVTFTFLGAFVVMHLGLTTPKDLLFYTRNCIS